MTCFSDKKHFLRGKCVQVILVVSFVIFICVFVVQVPAALLTFAWDAAVQADITAAGGKSPSLLKPELLETLQSLS